MSFDPWSLLDFVFAAIILISIALALTKGLAREVISLGSLLGGFLLAAFFYEEGGRVYADFAKNETVANLLGFLSIFLGCLLVGAVASFLVNRLIKMASLEWIDRLLGGIFGLLRGWAVASIIVLALIAFPVKQSIVSESYLAPYLLAGAQAAVLIVPQKLKTHFDEEYKKVLQAWNQNRNPL